MVVFLAALVLGSIPVPERAGQGGDHPLPLVEAPVAGGSRTIALVISGDGDWAGADRHIAAALNANGVSVVGLKARSYLQQFHPTPELAAGHVAGLIRDYVGRWDADSVLVVGYSRGADLAPFVINRLPADVRERISMLVLVSPSPRASFEFHLTDLIAAKPRETDLPVEPELTRLRGFPILCVYGLEDADSLCRVAGLPFDRVIPREGGHRPRDARGLGALVAAEWARR